MFHFSSLVCFAAQRHNALRHKDTSQQAKHAILVAVCVLRRGCAQGDARPFFAAPKWLVGFGACVDWPQRASVPRLLGSLFETKGEPAAARNTFILRNEARTCNK